MKKSTEKSSEVRHKAAHHADQNASQVGRIGKLPYKPDSFTVSDVRKAVKSVKREMAQASGGPR